MKIVLVSILVLGALLIAYTALRSGGAAESRKTGDLRDIEGVLQSLRESENPQSFLIVSVLDTGDFIQFSSNESAFEMDFPQITDRQKELRERFEATCAGLGLQLSVNRGTDGSEFLDYELEGEISVVSNVVRVVLTDVFGVGSSTSLQFELQS